MIFTEKVFSFTSLKVTMNLLVIVSEEYAKLSLIMVGEGGRNESPRYNNG